MAEEITGATVGDVSYIVAYLDVNTGNLYNSDGTLYGNNTLASFLGNEFTLELHYVQDISTSSNPEEWVVWDGLKDKDIVSTLAFDNDFRHAFKSTVLTDASIGATTLTLNVPDANKDTLNTSGTLVINPFGTEEEQMDVNYTSFTNVSGSTFTFTLEEALTSDVTANTSVRVSDPVYMYIDSNSIYEANIPSRYDVGVFKFPMKILSRKLLSALDYSGVSGVNGTIEHKIYTNKNTVTGITVSGSASTFHRDSTNDKVAIAPEDSTNYVFCYWTDGTNSYYTKGIEIQANTPLYSISGNNATLLGVTASPVIDSELVIFRTFAFPFVVRNLVDYNTAFTVIPTDIDWATNYIISIVRNNIVSGTVYSNSPDYLTITNGGITVNARSSNFYGVTDSNERKKLTTVGAVQDFTSQYVASNSIDSSYVSSANVIPQSAISGLSSSLNSKQDVLTGGYRTEIVSGNTVSQQRVFNINNVTGNVSSVTLLPGEAYKIQTTTSSITLNHDATLIPEGKYGLESHLEIFVANTGYVVTGTNVVLAEALEPNAVNNCLVRFHDGKCIISIEDHVYGYVVTVAGGTGSGTLYDGLRSAQGYIAVNATLDGQILDLNNVHTVATKHLVGNGYTRTIVSGGISCSEKVTFANLGMSNVTVSSGTLTLGDVFIPSGSTVAVSGGGLSVEKVTGNGGTIDLGGTSVTVSSQGASYASGCVFTGGYVAYDIGHSMQLELDNCIVSGNSGSSFAGGIVCYNTLSTSDVPVRLNNTVITSNKASGTSGLYVFKFNNVVLSGSTISGNEATIAGVFDDIELQSASLATAFDCTLGKVGVIQSSVLTLAGSNTVDTIGYRADLPGFVTISSGAVVDLTGNTNTTPINPGGGVTFAPGGATVYPSAGSASAYMLGGMTVPQIGNTNIVNLNSSNVVISSGGTAYASGCTFTSGSASNGGAIAGNAFSFVSLSSCVFSGGSASTTGGAMYLPSCSADLSDCTIIGNSGTVCGGIAVRYAGGKATLSNCIVSGNSARDIVAENGTVEFLGGCTVGTNALTGSSGVFVFAGTNQVDVVNTAYGGSGTVTISSGASINLTSSINPGGTGGITILTGGCTVNGVEITGGTYTSIVSSGGSAVINQ